MISPKPCCFSAVTKAQQEQTRSIAEGNCRLQEQHLSLVAKPLELDPSRRPAHVTGVLTQRQAKLAASLEQAGQTPENILGF